MADKKPEVNLEIGSGFFRITALDAIYNITVLAPQESSASRVVERIVEVEKQAEMPPLAVSGDDYYKKVSSDLYHDIGNLAKSLSSTMTRIPMEDQRQKRASLDEAGEKIEDAKAQLKDIVSMTENATMEIMDSVEAIQSQTNSVKELLSALKDHAAFGVDGGDAASGDAAATVPVADLQRMMGQALDLIVNMQAEGAATASAPPPAAAPAAPVKRYVFVIDVIFQTIYELCTNEAVKGHITKAREQAKTLFDNEIFLTQMNAKVSKLQPDGDNFFTIPLGDVLKSLHDACSDAKIQGLFKKMVSGQAEIFLDGNLPIEAPPMEEVAGTAPPAAPTPAPAAGADPRLGELAGIIEQCLAASDALGVPAAPANGLSAMTKADQAEIFSKIEAAFGIATNICGSVSKINEALSFQDLSGQQILKIIKLLGDFQVQLLAIVVSFGSQLKRKEEKPDITAEESKRLAQEDVDSYINKINAPAADEEGGVLDQDAVNKMLADMGF
ncbi:MAG: protein phosphatase CheZ [Desulfobulbaceae bacterium]|nr:protein phosphatase CheZ [Desulfobulbaceae bacterium]